MKDGFILYKGMYQPIANLANAKFGMLMKAIFEYQISGVEIDIDDDIKIAFLFFKNQFEIDKKKYEDKCKMRSELGKLGGLAKASKSYQKLAKSSKPSLKDKDKDKVKDKDDIKEILSDEEYIISNNNQLYIIWMMISYGLILKKDKQEIEDLVNRVTVLGNDYLDRTEGGSLDRETGKRYINQWYDYVVGLPKKQTNIKNSVRNSFILYSGKRGKK